MNSMLTTAPVAFIAACAMTAHQLDRQHCDVQSESTRPAATAVRPGTSSTGKVAASFNPRRRAVSIVDGEPVWIEAEPAKLDLASSRFDPPPDSPETTEPCMSVWWTALPFMEAHYRRGVNCGLLLETVYKIGFEFVERGELTLEELDDVVLHFAAIIWKESHGYDPCIGAGGERGILQIHPCHRAGMRRAGLSFDNPGDRIRQGYRLYINRRDKGATGWRCYRAWSVTFNKQAPAVKTAYAELREQFDEATQEVAE